MQSTEKAQNEKLHQIINDFHQRGVPRDIATPYIAQINKNVTGFDVICVLHEIRRVYNGSGGGVSGPAAR